jgi:acyl carrier protein
MLLSRKFGTFSEASLKILQKFDSFNSEKFSPNAEMKEFGLDSLDTVEYVIALEDVLKIELTDEEALAINSVNQALKTFKKYKEIE